MDMLAFKLSEMDMLVFTDNNN